MRRWKGNWIWCAGDAAPKNFYLYVRKTAELPGKVSKATARVCADSRYKLFVNGKLVGRGPARSFPQYQHYDEYDLTRMLKKGENVIAALVHHYGENTFQYHLGRGAFLFDAEVEVEGKKIAIVSDESWKVKPSRAWHRKLPRMDIQLGFQEIYDMNKAPQRWMEAGCDDSGWEDATLIGPAGTPPWRLIPRDIPFLTEYQIYPAKVLQTGAADASQVKLPARDKMNISLIQSQEKREKGVKGLFANAKSLVRYPQIGDLLESELMKPRGEPAKLMRARAAASHASARDVVVKPSSDGRSGYIVLDFGKEVVGYVNFKVKSNCGGTVDIGYSELLEDGIVNAHRCGVRYADRVILKPGEREFETFDKRAFRYMQIDFRDLKGPVVLESVGLRFSTYPVRWRGSFACSDQKLNDIRRISAYTVHLNMEDAYTDCPWRERAQWMGDARVEALVNYYAFGDTALARQMLREVARSQHEDGITNCFAPGDLGPCETIPSFCLIWIMSIGDYYTFTGDQQLAAELYPNVRKAIKWFTDRIDSTGLASNLPYWMFIDWAPLDIRGAVTTLNCFLVRALREASRMAGVLGKPGDQENYCKIAQKLVESINEHLLDSEKGVYVDCLCEGDRSKVVSEQSNSLAVLFDIAPRKMWKGILDYIHNAKNDVVRAGSPYFSFYVLHALWHAGEKRRALNYIRRKWGQMLAEGATTCWEQWNQNYSLCHGWSGGPALDLPAQVLGVRPILPGFSSFEVTPETFGLDWAEGTVPSPRGDIQVCWKRGETFTLDVSVPRGTTAVVTLPDAVEAGRVRINGKKRLPHSVRLEGCTHGKPIYCIRGRDSVTLTY